MTACACIVETRPIPNIEEIIMQHDKFLSSWFEETRWIKNEPINSIADYNRLLTSKRFWRVMPDKVLIFQTDSFMLKDGIEDFLQYDYVGAPWKFQFSGGNGGLSLRDSKAMLKVINNTPYDGRMNEDVYFCNAMHELGMNLAPRNVCKKFSVESIYELGTIGGHCIEKYLTPSECNAIMTQYK